MKEEDKNLHKIKFNSLIKEIAKGKQAAFDAFYSAYGRYVYSVTVSVTKSSCLADEVVDDVLFKIWQNASKLKKIENPLGWLYIVTTNCAKDRLKAEKAFSEIFDIPQDDKNIEDFITKETFLSDISPLSEEEQLILILYHIQGLTFKMIAKELKKPMSTVTSIYYRAKEKLKQTVKIF
ncbi:MAG: sigma-70 family RNA polymerase sigma factor [Clostridia bacterium]|nr:sigma-70 family RNA polymerase sigma factor [Clostridia bacterium]